MLKHRNITYFYRFLAEAIIAFLVINPFTFDYYEASHYWGYLFIIVVTGGCFFLLEKYHLPIGYYFLVFPLTVLLFYLFDFPLGLTFLLPLIFTWRYMSIRSYKSKSQSELHLHMLDARYNREMIYIHVTLIIGVFDVLYAKEIYVMYFVFLQFIILLAGNLLSHVALLDKKERKTINLNPFLSVPAFLIIGSVAVYFIFDPFRQLVYQAWSGFQSFLVFFIGGIARVIGFILPDLEKPDASEEQKEVIIEAQQQDDEARNPFDGIPDKPGIDDSILVIVVTSIIIGVILFLIFRAVKHRREQVFVEADTAVEHGTLDGPKRNQDNLFNRIFSKRDMKPSHPVRNLVYTFERKATDHEFGRYPFESIDEWFRRLQVDVDETIYEKVRYGDLEVTEQETDELKQQLKAVDFEEVENNLKKKRESLE